MNNQTDTQDTSPSLSDEDIDAIAVATFATIHKSAIVSASRWDLLFARAIEAKCRTLRAGQREPVAWIEPADFETLQEDGWCVVHASSCDPCSEHNADVPLYRRGAGQSPTAWIDGQEFFDVVFEYRSADQNSKAVFKFVAIQDFIRAALRSTLPETTGGKGS